MRDATLVPGGKGDGAGLARGSAKIYRPLLEGNVNYRCVGIDEQLFPLFSFSPALLGRLLLATASTGDGQ